MSSATTVDIPGYTTGTWAIDPVHSDVSFTVRHLGVAKVRGSFGTFEGTITLAENPLESQVSATIDTTSFDTGNAQRDAHVRGADFLDTDTHPRMTFRSTGVRKAGEDFALDGELTLAGVTKPVTLALEINGFADGLHGSPVVGFSASGTVDRTEFGVGDSNPMISTTVALYLEIEAALTA